MKKYIRPHIEQLECIAHVLSGSPAPVKTMRITVSGEKLYGVQL